MSAYSDKVLLDGALSYWRLGESAGTTAVDQKGILNGTYTGSTLPTLGAASLLTGDADTAISQARLTNQGVDLGNPAAVKINTGTLEAWVKTTYVSGAQFEGVLVKQDAYALFILSGNLVTYVWGGAGQITGSFVADGLRHHVACVFQQGVAGGSQLYVDGVPTGPAFLYTTANQSGGLKIARTDTSGQEFSGTIDEVALYSTALSPAQILAHYNLGTTPPVVGPAQTVLAPGIPGAGRSAYLANAFLAGQQVVGFYAGPSAFGTPVIKTTVAKPALGLPSAGAFGTPTVTRGAAPAAPVADFVGVPVNGFAPLVVQFTDTSTNSPTSWAWDFGD